MKVQGSVRRVNVNLIMVLLACCLLPAMLHCAGYQEEKLFDGNIYTSKELALKIADHSKETDVINDQIRALEADIDWLVLKINQIQDSGRSASHLLKDSIGRKEKKIQTLIKSKARLENLVNHYTGILDSIEEKASVSTSRETKTPLDSKTGMKDAGASSKPVRQETFARTADRDEDKYDGVSKIELEKAVTDAGLSDWVEIIGTGSCLRMENTLPILFPTGSARISGEYKDFLKKMAEFLKSYDVKVLVTGYADKVPIHNKKYPSNFELGATRAANIVHQFVGYGLKPSIFKIESSGKFRYASKQQSMHNSLERRAEVTIIFSG